MEFDATKPRARARALGLIAVAGLLAAACAPAASTAPSAEPAAPTDAAASPSEAAASADPMADLIAAAQAEGALTAIALPDDWCNYGEVISTFESKYGIDVTVLDPLARLRRGDRGHQGQRRQPGPAEP